LKKRTAGGDGERERGTGSMGAAREEIQHVQLARLEAWIHGMVGYRAWIRYIAWMAF